MLRILAPALLLLATSCAGLIIPRDHTAPREKIVIAPKTATARIGDKVKFSAASVEKDTFDLDFLWSVSNPDVVHIHMSTGEVKVVGAGRSDVCAAPFHRYLPLGADQKTVSRTATTGFKLIVGMGSLKPTCLKDAVIVP